ncbi:amino acid ABC transporter substrate-binding protein [Synechocystis sp. LKSZ1]|uniref:amino acid ABC transporter substrate-binding protein n=1 Tax=Synechocystis sp. LKSZ1 TaxID=3144951 RepID=UPI00336BFF11
MEQLISPKWQWLVILLGWLWSSCPSGAQASSTLEQIQATGLLKIAVREDAVPFGYQDLNQQWTGICIDFAELLKAEVVRQLNNPFILVKLYQSTLFNRFDLVTDNGVALECGPNTIRPDVPETVTFSRPIFLTGTQFLIRADSTKTFNPQGELDQVDIGVLRDTTTAQFLRQRYPQARLQEFQGITGRTRGVQALQQEKIDAFASDGILLFGEALLLNLNLGQDYLIVPKMPLDCIRYGLILPGNDPEWKALVNRVLALPEARAIYRKWVGSLLPVLQESNQACRTPSPSSTLGK